eukprot:7056936-Prymnesium_polylepis.1
MGFYRIEFRKTPKISKGALRAARRATLLGMPFLCHSRRLVSFCNPGCRDRSWPGKFQTSGNHN